MIGTVLLVGIVAYIGFGLAAFDIMLKEKGFSDMVEALTILTFSIIGGIFIYIYVYEQLEDD